MFRRPPRRIRFVGAQLRRVSNNQCLARVELQQAGYGSYMGTAVGASPDEEGLRTTAKATAAALMQSVGRDHSLQVHGVKVLQGVWRTGGVGGAGRAAGKSGTRRYVGAR